MWFLRHVLWEFSLFLALASDWACIALLTPEWLNIHSVLHLPQHPTQNYSGRESEQQHTRIIIIPRRRTIRSWPNKTDQSRVPGTDNRTIIMIVTNEFPKCFGNVKNLIKIILRVMRPRFVCREHHHPQALVLLLAHGF